MTVVPQPPGLARLNRVSAAEAAAELRQCCGSSGWATQMAAARPFDDMHALLEAADRVWQALSEDDWLEAFASHPRIGVQTKASARAARSASWSAEEQSGVTSASLETLEALDDLNRRYEARFGYIYIVCATGRTADEMRALLETRLHNDPATELGTAAEEQRRITAIRLLKLAGADDVERAAASAKATAARRSFTRRREGRGQRAKGRSKV